MNNGPTIAAAFFALRAALLLSPPTMQAAEEEPAGRPAPAIELGAPFADNAILQRQMPVPVWGWSKPGTKVTVEFAGQKKSATAGTGGKWIVRLEPLKANATPRRMVIADSAGKRVTLENILVGEVWMASGQSNMQWVAGRSSCRLIIEALSKDAKAAKRPPPPIREGKVTNVFSSLHPIEHAKGAWSDGTRFSGYSAIAFAFAYELYKELNVPIGILNCAFSTTQIQAWTPREGIESGTDDYTRGLYERILEGDFRTPEHKAAWDQYYQDLRAWAKANAELYKKGLPLARVPSCPGKLHGNRDISWMFNGKINPVIPYAIRGAIWNQGYANAREGKVYYHNLHSLIRGWRKLWNKSELPVYFHQFYCPGGNNDGLSLNSTAEMRLGTWLARDIPHANMASQIDVSGAVHYYNKAVPGRRLARHALKNQYGKDLVADGPMFKSYKVDGKRLIVEFDHAEGGLLVGETGTQASPRTGSGFANPTVIANGEDKVTVFYIADADRVWHRAKVKIDGETVILTAPGVSQPHGVAYGCNGIGWLPNLYNRALLPMTPFIYYDHKLVTSDTWPDEPIKVAGVARDPLAGKRGAPLLASQYRDNAVIQAGVPTPFWGDAPAGSVVTLSFAGTEKAVKVGPNDRGWQLTVPGLPASAQPKEVKVTCTLDGELIHIREVKNIVVGDVWYVAVPAFDFTVPMETEESTVRMLIPSAKKRTNPMPFRYRLEIPGPGSRYYAIWRSAKDFGYNKREPAAGTFANILGARIFAQTRKPVGIVLMNTRDRDLRIKSWIRYERLKQAPSLMADYKALQPAYPDNPAYFDNVETFISDWKTFWKTVPRKVLAAKRLEEGRSSIELPRFAGARSATSSATRTYNMLISSFNPGNFKGAICLTPPSFFAEDDGANFGSEFSVMANCWKESFGGADPHFFYTIPSKKLAPRITRPRGIKGKTTAYEIDHWLTAKRKGRNVDQKDGAVVNKQLLGLIELVIRQAYE